MPLIICLTKISLVLKIGSISPMKGNFKKGGWKGGKNSNKAKEVQINFFFIDSQRVGIQIPYGYCIQTLKNMIRDVGEGVWSFDDKCWVIKRESYEEIVQKFQDHFWRVNNQKGNNDKTIKVNPIEPFVIQAEQKLQKQLIEIKLNNVKGYAGSTLKYISAQTLIDPESLPFYKRLFEFQKQCLRFGIKHHGRLLLADEMGVGKTIQSLAVAYVYKYEWPLLIICPPTLKFNWQNQVKRWYPDIQPHQIQLVNNQKTALRVSVQVIIISYDLAWRIKDMFDSVRVVIADEAHYLKGQDSKRSLSLVPFLSSRKRVILLTGTPAFARPKQIFNLIQIIRPDLFKAFGLFGNRYCDPTYNHWSHSVQYNGCKNQKQLYYLLKNKIMIRRLKAEVLTELPDKNRQKITLETDSAMVKEIKQVLDKNNISKMETFFSEFMYNKGQGQDEEQGDKREEIMEAYRMSGMAKIKAVKDYIMEILQNNTKILVFAHHRKVMDQIETQLKNNKVKFMRIDGQVSQARRQQNVQNFQNDPEILVALLSITAAGVGITLTAASTVIFAELHWTPALMIQAEDRAHRVGQKDSVNCHYLIGENTLDQLLYKFLEKKVLNVSSFVDGQSKDLEVEELKKGQKGKISKKQEFLFVGQGNRPKRDFGSGMLEQLPSHKKNFIHEQEYGSSQKSELTDISVSTGSIKPSRKKVPSPTLNKFILKPRPTVQEMPQLSHLEEESEKYERRRTIEFRDEFYGGEKYAEKEEKQQRVDKWWIEEKKQQKSKTKVQSNKKGSKKTSIDSDEEFQQIYQKYLIDKSQKSSQNSKKEQNDRLNISATQTVSPQSNCSRTLSNPPDDQSPNQEYDI